MKPSPCGAPAVPFSSLLADTILEFGEAFAEAWLRRSRLPAWERAFWLAHPLVRRTRPRPPRHAPAGTHPGGARGTTRVSESGTLPSHG